MLIPFENMPTTARVWIYQADKNIQVVNIQAVEGYLTEKINGWTAHGANLSSSFKILHNRFIIIGLDENMASASGCSIDASTQWFRELAAKFEIDFFDRSIAYLAGNEIKTADFLQVKSKVISGEITPDTLIFNNLVKDIDEFNRNFLVRAADIWLKKYFINVPA
jgi:hypothetical protein